jgi:phosphoribosylglycinamide formyltransferase 1
MSNKRKIAIFASGSGTNAQNIAEYFRNNQQVTVDSLFCNRKDAFVLQRAEKMGVPSFLLERDLFYSTDYYVRLLEERGIDLIVLAGFLWWVPENLVKKFRIINIHPALLPRHGGKGMYGMKVHQAVVENREEETGITIHYVNEKYDEGEIIFQAKCNVEKNDRPEDVAQKVHQLEYTYFPEIIEKVVLQKR